jgi:hypothetical protein
LLALQLTASDYAGGIFQRLSSSHRDLEEFEDTKGAISKLYQIH